MYSSSESDGHDEMIETRDSYFEVRHLIRELSLKEAHEKILKKRINVMNKRYEEAGKAEIRATINCPTCNRHIIKNRYQKRFCGPKCKDKYWNTVDDKRRHRAKKYKK